MVHEWFPKPLRKERTMSNSASGLRFRSLMKVAGLAFVLALPAGTSFEYKYVKVDDSGAAVWESGANRTATVGADGTLALTDSWR